MQYIKGDFSITPNIKALKGKDPQFQSAFFWICVHADENGRCFPSYSKIAECGGMSPATAKRRVKALESEGFIVKTKRSKESGGYTSNEYQIMLVDETPCITETQGGSITETPPLSPSDTTLVSERPTNYTQVTTPNKLKVLEGNLPAIIETKGQEISTEFIDQNAWSEWEQYRKEKKKTLTPTTIKKQIAFLNEHRADHAAIIEQSIRNGWTGLFEIKGDRKSFREKSVAFIDGSNG